MAKAKKKGRAPALRTNLAVRVQELMDAKGIVSVGELERLCDVPTDGIRALLRGHTARNRPAKLARLSRAAEVLGVPAAELAELAGLAKMGDRAVDFGTREIQIKRVFLSQGGDAAKTHDPVAILAERQRIGRLGISEFQERAARLFARTINRRLPDAPKQPASIMGRLDRMQGGHAEHDHVIGGSYAATYRAAMDALKAADAMRLPAGTPKPSAVVWDAVIREHLPAFAAHESDKDVTRAERLEWVALAAGLEALRVHFRRAETQEAGRQYRDAQRALKAAG